MIIFFEIMKLIFFACTILLGLFFSRGTLLFDQEQYLIVQQLAMPGYMVLCGIMVGYLIGAIRLSRYDDPKPKVNHIYALSLVFGLILGVALALITIYYVM